MKIQKLAKDKTTLKHHLKVTRHNNGVLKNMVEELKNKTEVIEGHLHETKAKVLTGNNELAILKKQNEEWKINNEEIKTKYETVKREYEEVKTENGNLKTELVDMKAKNEVLKFENEDLKPQNQELRTTNGELKVKNEELKTKVENIENKIELETKTARQCQSENDSNLKLILELKTSQSEMNSDLEDCKTTDADLMISKEELKECLEELDFEMKKNIPPKAVLVLSTWSTSNKPMVISFEGQFKKTIEFLFTNKIRIHQNGATECETFVRIIS